jgi:CheY-like chemotaxis protein
VVPPPFIPQFAAWSRGFSSGSSLSSTSLVMAPKASSISLPSYDVIVLDLMMPRVDGAGVLKYLSQYFPEQLCHERLRGNRSSTHTRAVALARKTIRCRRTDRRGHSLPSVITAGGRASVEDVAAYSTRTLESLLAAGAVPTIRQHGG